MQKSPQQKDIHKKGRMEEGERTTYRDASPTWCWAILRVLLYDFKSAFIRRSWYRSSTSRTTWVPRLEGATSDSDCGLVFVFVPRRLFFLPSTTQNSEMLKTPGSRTKDGEKDRKDKAKDKRDKRRSNLKYHVCNGTLEEYEWCRKDVRTSSRKPGLYGTNRANGMMSDLGSTSNYLGNY